MLHDLRKVKPVWVELGLQTMHERTVERIHRGYSLPVFEEACRNLKAIGVEVIVHVILGLPGESREDMLDTIRYLSGGAPLLRGNDACASVLSSADAAAPLLQGNDTCASVLFSADAAALPLRGIRGNDACATAFSSAGAIAPLPRGNDTCATAFSSADAVAPLLRGSGTVQRAADFPVPDGIKIQQLQILRGTQLAREYAMNPFPIATLEEYCALVKDCLDILLEEVVIHRLTGDGPKALLIAPAWSGDKKRVLNTMRAALSI